MSKSNKELAVELYAAIIQAAATVAANADGRFRIPSSEEAVAEVSKLTELLKDVKE